MRSISYPRRAALGLIAALLAVVGLTACDPSDPVQFQQWIDLNPTEGRYVSAETMNEPQRAVVDHIQAEQGKFLAAVAANQRPTDCISAMRQVFPASAWSWWTGIVMRESGNNPLAQNPSSSAAGCAQLLRLHSARFNKLGYTWEGDRYNALANTRVAYDLYLEAGTSPWRL